MSRYVVFGSILHPSDLTGPPLPEGPNGVHRISAAGGYDARMVSFPGIPVVIG